MSLKTALENTGLPFAHYAWSKDAPAAKADHGVWAEDGDNTLYANGKHAERAIQGAVDYFTRSDDGAAKRLIEAALDSIDIAWYLNSIQYEEDTGYLHYEWVFECGEDNL